MGKVVTLLTERTELRAWRPSDRDAFAALNADPAVMEHFPSPLDRVQSDDFADRISSGLEKRGWGLWAMEVPGRFGFVGFVGLNEPGFDVPVDLAETPPLEIGWRLGQAAWNQGFASEAAFEVLRFAFAELGRREVVSFTTPGNDRSRRVMEKLGLHTDPRDDFDHPHMAELGHDRVTRHVLYRIGAAEHAAQEHDTARRQLRDHVGRFNLGVRSGDWSAMLRGLAPNAVFTAAGAAAGVLRVEGRMRSASPTPPTRRATRSSSSTLSATATTASSPDGPTPADQNACSAIYACTPVRPASPRLPSPSTEVERSVATNDRSLRMSSPRFGRPVGAVAKREQL